MFDNFAIADQQADGYDGDPLNYYPLDQGKYHSADASSRKTLTRRGAQDYLLVDAPTGMRYVFKGYKAAWRSQPADAGKLMRYDELDRVKSVTNYTLGKTISYDYDEVGSRTKITDPEGLVISYTYDTRGNMTITSYDYDHNRRPTLIRTTTPTSLLSSYAYTYDAVGNRTSMTDDYGLVAYSYDDTDKLVEVDGDEYHYDVAGKLASKTTPYGDVTYSYI